MSRDRSKGTASGSSAPRVFDLSGRSPETEERSSRISSSAGDELFLQAKLFPQGQSLTPSYYHGNFSPAITAGKSSDSATRESRSQEAEFEEMAKVQVSNTFVPPSNQSQPVKWTASIFRIGPLVGLAALCFTILQIVAAYAVLKASDGAAVSSWKYQPNVYLAILTAISNKARTWVFAYSVDQNSC